MRTLFLLLFLHLLYQAGSVVGSSILPPRLNVTDEYIVRAKENGFSAFSLRCEGQANINWDWSTDLHPEDEVVEIENYLRPSHDYQYVSTLTITEPDIIDTGFYYCHYDNATDYANDRSGTTSTYVYFHDGVSGLVKANGIEHKMVTTLQKLILDCKPTLPDMKVELYKNDELITAETEWDRRIGFIRRNLVVQDSGVYQCLAVGFEDQQTLYSVSITSENDQLPEPAIIIWPKNQVFLVGHEVTLNCSVIMSKPISFHWSYPNSKVVHNTTSGSLTISKSTHKISTLYIHNVTMEDAGMYTCTVTAPQAKANNFSRFIDIKETLHPYINISSVKAIKINESEPLEWKTDLYAYPDNPEIIYRDYKGHEVRETDRIRTDLKMDLAQSWLIIDNATVNDFGNYTIEVISSDKTLRKELTIPFYIKSKPYVSLRRIPTIVNVDQTINVTCYLRGYPIPEAEWSFQRCPHGSNNCSSSLENITFIEYSEKFPAPGNIRNVSATFLPPSSGILRCGGNNEHGHEVMKRDVVLSDIMGNFVFRHIGRNITTDIEDRSIKLSIIENDDFSLQCGAVKFSYKDVNLRGLGMEVRENSSVYSQVEYIESEKVTSAFKGAFTCAARHLTTGENEERKVTFEVLDEAEVMVTKYTNLKEGGAEMEVNDIDFVLNCTVSGTPEPVVSWFKDDIPLTRNGDFFNQHTKLTKNGQSIIFEYLNKEDHIGTYSCIAENRKNKIKLSLTIIAPAGEAISVGGKVAMAFACIGIVVLGVVVFWLSRKVKEERKFRKSFRKNELFLFEKGNICQLNPDCTADEQAELLPYSPEWEIKRDDITLGRQLGAGAFGRVVKAVVTDLLDDEPKTTVALKMCKSQSDQSQIHALTRELKVMIHLGKHLNIVNLMGANTVNIGKGELWILVEFCRYGNLLTFMHRHRKNFINQINPATGKIDPLKTVQDLASPLSSGSQGTRFGYQPTPITDMDGYLAPTPSKFNLAAVPPGRTLSSPPQSPTSDTGSSNGSCIPDGLHQQYADNPVYRAGLNRSVSDAPQVDPTLNMATNSTSGGSRISDARNSSAHSDQRSIGYYRDDHQIVNTDMTILQSVASPLSPSPHFPLSPTDSSHISDMGVDSQGNPFTFDPGQIPGINAPFTTSDLVCWGWQVAQGMDYLMRRKVLHGDLAARNLLLTENNVVKISDFGLSRDMYKNDIYMKKGDDLMPIKWMSIEAIRDRIFSVQSDVWAYGVTLWELFTLGSTPYPGIEVNKDFLTFLEDGNRMDRPKYANQDVYDIILDCWRTEPQDRPMFNLSAERLGLLMLPDLKGQYITMNDPYMLMNEERFKTETDYLTMMSSPDFNNLNRKDESELHYMNVPEVMDENRPSNYLRMQAPDVVGYSRVSLNRTSESQEQSAPPASHYLPMSSTKDSDSPMVDVFSPRPNEDSRFSFYPEGEEKSKSADLPEIDEENPDVTNEQVTENSSLMGNSLSDSDEKHNAKNADDLESQSSRTSEIENELPYVNLVTHGTDNMNL